jgi:hypothetical protein
MGNNIQLETIRKTGSTVSSRLAALHHYRRSISGLGVVYKPPVVFYMERATVFTVGCVEGW